MASTDLLVAGSDEDQENPPAHPGPYYLAREHTRYSSRRRHFWRPPTDVYETDSHVVIKVEVAGMDEDDFDISYVDRRLIIGGRRKDPVGKLIYQKMEIHYGEFRTEVRVGWALDEADIEAVYEQGFLFVMLPKATLEHHVQVRVRDGGDD